MKQAFITLGLLLALPLLLTAGDIRSNLDGVWIDRYDDDKLEVRDKRYGLEVKKRGLFRKKRIFREVDYNRYADQDGNVIEVLSNNRLVWKNRNNRSYKTFYRNGYYNSSYDRGRYDSNNGRDRYNNSRYDDRYGGSRYDNRNENYGQDRNQRSGRFDGRWRCADNRRNIFIESRGNGFRARKVSSDQWYDYTQDPYESNVYRCQNGEKYIFKDDSLIWYGRNGCDSVRFRRY